MTRKRIRIHRVLRPFRRRGFYMKVDDTWAHVQGDTAMSAETREALANMIRAAIKMREEGKL